MSGRYRLRGVEHTIAKMRRDAPFRQRYIRSVPAGRRRAQLEEELWRRDRLRMRMQRERWMRGRMTTPLTREEEEELQDYLDNQNYMEDLWHEDPN